MAAPRTIAGMPSPERSDRRLSRSPLVLGGLRMPIGGDIYALTFEGRYQWGSADSGGAANEFLGDKIDLGGGSISFGFLVRF